MVSDIAGLTGLAIIRAILAGERDPRARARLRDRRCKADEGTLIRALEDITLDLRPRRVRPASNSLKPVDKARRPV